MKFTCPKCDTRYSLVDDKFPPAQALRFTCRKCGNEMRVRRKDGLVESEEAGLAPEPPHESTRVASLAELGALAQASAQAIEWYVIIDRAQQGPYTPAQLAELRANAVINERTHVWREGLDDWQRLGRVPELSAPPPAAAPAEQTKMMSAAQLQAELAKAQAEERTSAVAATSRGEAASRPSSGAPASREEPAPLEDVPTVVPGGTLPPPLPRPTSVPTALPVLGRAAFEPLLAEPEAQAPALSPFSAEPSAPFDLDAVLREEVPVLLGQPPAERGESYLDAPPGEATRLFMSTAGLFRQRRNNRIAAVTAVTTLVVVGAVVGLDLAGVYTLPGMGVVYEVTGMQDPNVERAVARVEEKLQDATLSARERQVLRERLLGLESERAGKKGATRAAASSAAPKKQGLPEPHEVAASERTLAHDVFADARKQAVGLTLTAPEEVQAPSLPAGLTQEAITKVISDNGRSMKLCLEEAFKKGERPQGKMEVQVTIEPAGTVSHALVTTPQFRTSAMASCTIRRIKGWRFPRWNGEPVTVEFPYVLSAGM